MSVKRRLGRKQDKTLHFSVLKPTRLYLIFHS